MPNRRTRVPAGMDQLCLFPGDVAIRPRRVSGQAGRPSCAETGQHPWTRGYQQRLFGLPPDEVIYCPVCGRLFR